MNLQQVIRAVVCSAIVALCIAGAGLFPAQPVAGQETKPSTLHGAAAIDQLKQTGQYDSLQAALNQARFSVSRAEQTPLGRAAWHAPNPAAGYDAYITEEGVSIALNNESHVGLSLHSLGYGEAMQTVAPGKVSGGKQTINVAREGGVREWFVNGPDGLEHGFTLAEPPGARQAGAPLRLALQVSEGWRATANGEGMAVSLRSADGQAVEYGKLTVRDSLERNIPARLTGTGEQVVIEVEDSEATYPLTIDPLFSLQKKLLAPDGMAGDAFGLVVALSGDTLVVGAYADDIIGNANQGSAYVFTRSGTVWTFQQKLTAGDGAAGDQFGSEVALNGDTLVVGANGDDIDGKANQGSIYVFTRSGGGWTFSQQFHAYDGEATDYYGSTVAISDDMLAVGVANADTNARVDQGAVYVYTRSGSYWTFLQKLTANDGAADDFFGVDVALSGNTLAVGAFGDFVTHVDQGSVYIFTHNGTTWTQQQRVIASDGEEADLFGTSVALSGNTLVIGVPNDDETNPFQGSAYVFTRKGAVWAFQQKLTANDSAAFDCFGGSVAISDSTLVVGASRDDNGMNSDQGSAYVFTRNNAYWSQQQKLTAYDGAKNDTFGISVAISGDTIAVGAHSDDSGANSDQGSTYVFFRPTCSTFAFWPLTLSDGIKNVPYQQTVTVNGMGPYQFYLSAGALPPGISLSSSGLLSGTPATLGSYQFTIGATDLSTGCSGVRAYTITVAPCPTLVLAPPDLPNGALGTPYNYAPEVWGGVSPYRFVVKGKLPPGLSLSTDGIFSGTPTQAGYFPFTLLIFDANNCSSTWASAITITQSDSELGVARRPNSGKR